MCDVRVYLPSKRACQMLKLQFAEAGGGIPQFLPKLLPIGELDESELLFALGDATLTLKPPMSRLTQRFAFAELIRRYYRPAGPAPISVEQSVRLADSLLSLWDELERENLPFERFRRALPGDLQEHWQQSVEFLAIAARYWPEVSDMMGQISLTAYRNQLLRMEIGLLERHGSDSPVIAAGSTGTVAATADLLAAIARMPNGHLILPGLDTEIDESSWQAMDESHPQWQLKQLLNRIGVSREAVTAWDGTEHARIRQIAGREIMRPSEAISGWDSLPREAAEGIADLRLLSCRDPLQEARMIALLLRYHGETPERRITVVTPDRELARLIKLAAYRHGITLDDSGGDPLLATGPGMVFQLLAEAVEDPRPVTLLALLKHPCCQLGLRPEDLRERVLLLEKEALRGLVATPLHWETLLSQNAPAFLSQLIDPFRQAIEPMQPLFSKPAASFKELLEAHLTAAEALCTGADGGNTFLDGEEAEAFHECITQLRDASAVLPELAPAEYLTMVREFLAGSSFRPKNRDVNRFTLLSPIEARLLEADVVIVAGCREGCWPPTHNPDPWLNRSLRKNLGLPLPERRIGQSAHDLVMLLGHPLVYVTWPEKAGGAPVERSRFVERMLALKQLAAHQHPDIGPSEEPFDWRALADSLDMPSVITPVMEPSPTPGAAIRAEALGTISVTEVETLMRNPYAFYAKKILGLAAWEPLEAEPGPRELGQFFHTVMERFAEDYPLLPEEGRLEALLEIGRQEAAKHYSHFPAALPYVTGRLAGIAPDIIAWEERRRIDIREVSTEIRGQWQIPDMPVRLIAKADRIELTADEGGRIVDFKTGALPTKKDITAGLRSQLTLEALILLEGGFSGASVPRSVSALEYVALKPGTERMVCMADELLDEARKGITALLGAFLQEGTPFIAEPYGEERSDYEGLIRAGEWQG